MKQFSIALSLFLTLGMTGVNALYAKQKPTQTEHTVYVKMQTSEGAIYLALDNDRAPLTVSNFLSYVDSGYYTDTLFHRVIDGFMIQGGGFTKDLSMKEPDKPIKNEATNGRKNTYGTIAMAHTSDPHSATAQFFINVSDNSFLDHRDTTTDGFGYCVFGEVVAGVETVEKIRAVPVARSRYSEAMPKEPVVIESVTRVEADDKGLIAQKEQDPSQEEMAKEREAKAREQAKMEEEIRKRMEEFQKNNTVTGAKAFLTSEGYDVSGFVADDSGLHYLSITEGQGPSPTAESTVTVHYTGWLANGVKFDSSRDRGETITFPLSRVIPGWTKGVPMMKEGGKAVFIIPSALGYGARGAGGVIPPNAVLVFEIELIKIEQ